MFARLGRLTRVNMPRVHMRKVHPSTYGRCWMSHQGAPVSLLSEEETLMKNMGECVQVKGTEVHEILVFHLRLKRKYQLIIIFMSAIGMPAHCPEPRYIMMV